MFTGIVETLGIITKLQIANGCHHLTIKPQQIFADLTIGESIAVNGVCLTVTHFEEHTFNISIVPETLRLTNLGELQIGAEVNLERSLVLGSRLGGHYVQGHVDARGKILSITPDQGSALLVEIEMPNHLLKYVVPKGYIAIDGMSITVITTHQVSFTVTFIPHTQAVTCVKHYRIGTIVNLEVDMMGKYVEKLLGGELCNKLSNAS